MTEAEIKREHHIADQLQRLSNAHRLMATGDIKNGSKEMSDAAAIAKSVIRLLVEDYI